MRFSIHLSSPLPDSFRAAAVRGMFDVPTTATHGVTIDGQITLPPEWNVGAIVGASGAGKTSIARELWPKELVSGGHKWRAPCILDDFPKSMSTDEVVAALTAVGLSSPPVWLRPYKVLSTGQQFRADLARALAQAKTVVFDEFTSVVDRQVARAASAAVAKHVRKTTRQFVAVTCHRDILEWLEPDWVYDVDTGTFSKECLQRPGIPIELHKVRARDWWPLFRGHHYLTADIHKSAQALLCVARIGDEEQPVGFFTVIPATPMRGWWRGHRNVVLPDFQGLGIGNRMIELAAESMWTRERKRYRETSSSPALRHHRLRHPEMWQLYAGPQMQSSPGKKGAFGRAGSSSTSAGRLTATWVYLPADLRAVPRRESS